MFFRLFFFFFFLYFVTSNSNQEDLSISNYFHIGCLLLKSDTQFINNGFQENILLPYQAFSSPNLTIDLCFRLCRRWIILMNNNHTNCICEYTLNALYEINEYLGEVIPDTNCTTDALQIYSLTKNPYILPSPNEKNEDWSFEGCYRLDGLQVKQPDISFNRMSYTPALTKCQDHCKNNRNLTDPSFFLSLQISCYCLPITVKRSVSINMTVIRKPLVHCSFLPYVKNGFDNSFNATSVHVDTFAKINVHRYCSSSFVFNRNLYQCFKTITLDKSDSYSKITTKEACSPISIRTIEQYNHLLSLVLSTPSRIFIWINRNSTYLFDDLFKSTNDLSSLEDLCLVINVIQSSSPGLVSCSTAQSSDYIFCTQKPSAKIDESEFQSIKPIPIMNNINCPGDFILFNNLCYYVDISVVNNTRTGEEVCSYNYQNSHLVKFDTHQWGNANKTRFLGRTFDDILLEFFYYQLEKNLNIGTKTNKEWLRLLIGNKSDDNGCILRYFTRSTGAFIVSSSCKEGGYPICQSQPISIDAKTNKQWKIKFIIVSVFASITLISIVVLILYYRRDRRLQLNCHLKAPFNVRRKYLLTSATTNETFDASTGSYLQLEASPEPIPIDAYMDDSAENAYTTIEDQPNLPRHVVEENGKDEEDSYCTVSPSP